MNNAADAEFWAVTRLMANTAVAALVGNRIYSPMALAGAKMPMIVVAHQSGTDVIGVGVKRILSHFDLSIRAVGSMEQISQLADIADAIDEALVIGDGSDVGCSRSIPLAYSSKEGGMTYRNIGGIYRLTSGAG
jgi:hypothetical protein